MGHASASNLANRRRQPQLTSSAASPAVLHLRPSTAFTLSVTLSLTLSLALVLVQPSHAWRAVNNVPDTRHFCDKVISPLWPFSYTKQDGQLEERKGRFASNTQDFRHECDVRGVRSVCHRCEPVQCSAPGSAGGTATCEFQLQGVDGDQLPENIATSTDLPFALGPRVTHRYDYDNSDLICVWLETGACMSHSTANYSQCAVRCWGQTEGPPRRTQFGWDYPKDEDLPQGKIMTFAGVPEQAGFRDGAADQALFSGPQGMAIDLDKNIYVADTGNHVIRKITPGGVVSTLAGRPGVFGEKDGPGPDTLFSQPIGITVFNDFSTDGRVTIFVCDTGNHIIRRIREEPAGGSGNWFVETWAGGGTARADGIGPAGLQDGFRIEARFWTPRGVAVDVYGNVFVADTNNHIIRFIDAAGNVSTLAGTTRSLKDPLPNRLPEDEGCPFPCLEGVQGFIDGPRRASRFSYPTDVAIGENQTVLVTDGHRIRRITRSDDPFSTVQGIESYNRVYTLAGSTDAGDADGIGQDAKFDTPRGLMMTPDRRIYIADPVHCRIRRISAADLVAQAVDCNTRLVDVLRPSGCWSYDPAVDALDVMATDVANNIRYSYNTTNFDGFTIRKCIGAPPDDVSISSTGVLTSPSSMSEAVTGHTTVDWKEQTDEGTTYRFQCPGECTVKARNESIAGGDIPVWGSGTFADVSLLCAAAAHQGLIGDEGGLFSLTVTQSHGEFAGVRSPGHGVALEGATKHNITTQSLSNSPRTFQLYEYPEATVEVHTLAGRPTASLEVGCGHKDTQPALEGRLRLPSAISMYALENLTDSNFMYIADTGNHVIRAMTATCSKVCENGGRCVAPETCRCRAGWTGADCTRPTCATPCDDDFVCVGNECVCKPGYTGPACQTPLCVQECKNGAACSAPDTCSCIDGWFDHTCSSPICKSTCGNGGNCTAPDICTCPTDWTGTACRVPLCNNVVCQNGAECVAPDTCRCLPGWSGHDCSKPICSQGFLRVDPIDSFAPSPLRPTDWNQYVPCDIDEWCASTNEFDCQQLQRQYAPVPFPTDRTVHGFNHWESPDPGVCFALELDLQDGRLERVTPYRFEFGNGSVSPYVRFSVETLYPFNATDAGGTVLPWAAPFVAEQDRQIALVQYRNVSQGVYVCANGGECVAPDVCRCKPGWAGFDCRTPICNQGWYDYNLTSPYLDQGAYKCSTRAVTVWENPLTPATKFPGYVHGHPNYGSHYLDADKGWPDVHVRHEPLGNHTREGWRRGGWWERTASDWMHGTCPQFWTRTCDEAGIVAGKPVDLRFGVVGLVNDTDAAYRARVSYDDSRVTAEGRWFEPGGECIDHVQFGCFNNGTCVAPDTCVCAPGWEGHDCSLPVCYQSTANVTSVPDHNSTLVRADGVNYGDPLGSPVPPVADGAADFRVQYRKCPNNGNCTFPDHCTCEKGWGGADCTIPLCAQECFNGGECVAPDTCKCVVWLTEFRDGRNNPVYRKDNGDPQDTGWTGYDCNTPICTQHEQFYLNVASTNDTNAKVLVASSNLGVTFQAGCAGVRRFTPATRTRESSVALCLNTEWWEGVFTDTWANGEDGFPPESRTSANRTIRQNHDNYARLAPESEDFVAGPLVLGEGVYACHNDGSCIAPDVCECHDGWTGFDCSEAQCRHVNADGAVTTCLNGGICGFRDACTCIQRPSILWTVHPDEPQQLTGYTSDDCSMPKCVQGSFDAACVGVGPSSSSGQGCYRCPNGGNCTAPDFCTCPPEWTGHDCKTPVCVKHADRQILTDLNTVDAAKVAQFELDPCGSELVSDVNGVMIGHGNCTSPNVCQCLCTFRSWADADGSLVEEPWEDPLPRSIPKGSIFGRYDCVDGFEGALDATDRFSTCHLTIFVPSWLRRNSLLLLIIGSISLFFLLVFYIFVRRKLRQRYLLAKAERRRSRRSSEEEMTK